VWARRAAGGRLEILDRLQVARLPGLRVDVEDKDLAGLQARQPQLPAVVSEAAVMRLVASANRVAVNDLSVVG
jgi:hypothetical protein